MAVHLGERFKHANVQAEITKLVRANPKQVVHVPEALHYVIGDHIGPESRAALKVSFAGYRLERARADRYSGCPSGHLFRQSLRLFTSNHDTKTTRSSCNMACEYWNSIQSMLPSSLFRKWCKL